MTRSDSLIECPSTVKCHPSFLSAGKNLFFRSTQISVDIITRNGVDYIAYYKSSLPSPKNGVLDWKVSKQVILLSYCTPRVSFPGALFSRSSPVPWVFQNRFISFIHLNSQIISGCVTFFTAENKKEESLFTGA